MKKLSLYLVAVTALVVCNVNAQPTNKNVPGKTVKDTFALNLLSTLDRVIVFAEDSRQTARAMAGELLRTDRTGAGIYQPVIQLPYAQSMSYRLRETYRNDKYTVWEWSTILLSLPKEKGADSIRMLKARVDSLLPSITSRLKAPGITVTTYDNLQIWYREGDQLTLSVVFNKGLHNTEQQALDSIVQLYSPLLANRQLAAACAEKFGNAMQREGIASDLSRKTSTNVINEVANKDAEAAFQVLMNIPYPADYQAIFEQLPSGPKQTIRDLAKREVEKFNAEEWERLNRSKPDVVVQQKKQIEEKKPPTDPCEREKWELRLKPGYYVSGKGVVAYIRDYSCTSHTYTISWVNASNKLTTQSGITKDNMQEYTQTSASPFIVCSNCSGVGYRTEYDWVQTSAGGSIYARTNRQTNYPCGICKGAGFLKVR